MVGLCINLCLKPNQPTHFHIFWLWLVRLESRKLEKFEYSFRKIRNCNLQLYMHHMYKVGHTSYLSSFSRWGLLNFVTIQHHNTTEKLQGICCCVVFLYLFFLDFTTKPQQVFYSYKLDFVCIIDLSQSINLIFKTL